MTEDARNLPGEQLRRAMRHWVTGVSVVSSEYEGFRHGMTVNSFVSISLDPPLVTITLANSTRTCGLIQQSGKFGVTILSQEQEHVADLFAGRLPDGGDRFAGLDTFSLSGSLPLIRGGLASIECNVVQQYAMPNSTLFIGQVQQVWVGEGKPLIYFNRTYHRVGG